MSTQRVLAQWPDTPMHFPERAARQKGTHTLGRYADAEPLLLSGYESLKALQTGGALPNLRKTLDRIIRLYEAWEKPDKAAEWRDKRDRVQAQVFLGLCPQRGALAVRPQRYLEMDRQRLDAGDDPQGGAFRPSRRLGFCYSDHRFMADAGNTQEVSVLAAVYCPCQRRPNCGRIRQSLRRAH